MAKKKEDPMQFTKYEKARMLGSRALQISHGAPFMIKISKKQLEEIKYNPIEVAKLEMAEGAIPINIIRSFPQAAVEESEPQEAKN